MYCTMKCFLIFPFCELFLHTFSYYHFYAIFFQLHTVKFHQFIAFHLFSFFYSWIFTFPYSTGWQGILLCNKFLVCWWNSIHHRRLHWFWISCCYCFRVCHSPTAMVLFLWNCSVIWSHSWDDSSFALHVCAFSAHLGSL